MSEPFQEIHNGLICMKILDVSTGHITIEDEEKLMKASYDMTAPLLTYELLHAPYFYVYVNHFDEGYLEQVRKYGFSGHFINIMKAALEIGASRIVFDEDVPLSPDFPYVR